MSSSSSFQSAPAQRVPAWKRLGLKLKQSPSDTASASPVAPSEPDRLSSFAAKRNRDTLLPTPQQKRARQDFEPKDAAPRRRVSFAEPAVPTTDQATSTTTTTTAPAAAAKPKKPKKKSKGPAKTAVQQPKREPKEKLAPALDYLRQWRMARSTWKFNKNYQTILLDFAFDPDVFPAADTETLYEYIRGLQGATRIRLRGVARDIRREDVDAAAKRAANGEMDVERDGVGFEELIASFKTDGANGGGKVVRKRRLTFNEVEFVGAAKDGEYRRRVVKRMRAEMVLDELADDEDSVEDAPRDTNPTGAGSGKTTATASRPSHREVAGTTAGVSRPGSSATEALPQNPRKRKRNLRVTADDDTSSESSDSSSESESESADDASSEGEDSDEDDEMDLNPEEEDEEDEEETSSSSSSSSSSEDEDEDEDESGEESDEEARPKRASKS